MNTPQQRLHILGSPIKDSTSLAKLVLPFKLRLAWGNKPYVSFIRVHPSIKAPLEAVYKEIMQHYTPQQIKDLSIDIFGGCHNYRKERNGSNWSSHAWAIAVDHDPARNQLHMKANMAAFARPEYEKFIQAFYNHGFYNLGIEKGYDYMHFEYNLKNIQT